MVINHAELAMHWVLMVKADSGNPSLRPNANPYDMPQSI